MDIDLDINGLVQERRNSIANALELRLSCTNPSIWYGWSFTTLNIRYKQRTSQGMSIVFLQHSKSSGRFQSFIGVSELIQSRRFQQQMFTWKGLWRNISCCPVISFELPERFSASAVLSNARQQDMFCFNHASAFYTSNNIANRSWWITNIRHKF